MNRSWLLLGLSFLSGAAALLYETIWLRWFNVLFGSTVYAASATLCAFFAGLALGATIFGRMAGRTRRPLILYGAIELGAGAAALLVPLVIQIYEPIYAAIYGSLAESPTALIWAKVGLALIGIVPPATLLGGALPALAAAFVGDARALGRRGNGLYGTNTLGAAAGTALGTLWLPEWIGVQNTYAVAVGLSALVGLGAIALARAAPSEAAAVSNPGDREQRAARSLRIIAFSSGAGTLAFEVLMIHALALVIGRTVYSFGAVLLTVLVCLAVSALIVAAIPPRIRTANLLVIVLGIEALLLLLLPAAIFVLTDGLASHHQTGMLEALLLAGLFGGPALLVGGLVFPLTFRLAGEGAAGSQLGGLLAWNTIGGVLGSLGASFVLLDVFGLWTSFLLLAIGYALAAVASEGGVSQRIGRATAATCTVLLVLSAPVSPLDLPVTHVREGEKLIEVVEGAHGVVSVTEIERKGLGRDRYLRVDGHYILSGSLAQRHQRRLGHIAMLLRGDPRSVLFVGSATGETAASALSHPVERIVLVEIVPPVQTLAAKHFAEANRGVYTDARTRRVIEDGRNHLRASPERYDVIVADLFVPARPGTGSMYSVDHFRATREHLEPGGVFAQWLPIYQFDGPTFEMVVRSFLEVFPDALAWRGDFFASNPTLALIGLNGAPPDPESIERAARRLADAEPRSDDPWVTDPERLWMFYLGRAEALVEPGGEVSTDAFPRFEFIAGRSQERDRSYFLKVDWPKRASKLADLLDHSNAPYLEVSLDAVRRGHVLARANRMLVSNPANLAKAVALMREGLPENLLREHDMTVTEVWPRVLLRGAPVESPVDLPVDSPVN